MPSCDFNKVTKHGHGCPPVNLLNIFRRPFLKNTSARLLLKIPKQVTPKFFLQKFVMAMFMVLHLAEG